MKKLYLIPLTVVALIGFLVLSSFDFQQQAKPWKAPETAKKMKNTVKNDAESISIGKSLYAKHCRSCHGKDGEGDGTKAAELATFPGDFTLKEFQAQTDGEIFYKTTEGRDDMPSFKKKIPETDDIWSIINYLRTFKTD